MNRRGFLGAILAAGVAPAIVRSSSLMKLVVPSQEIIVPVLVPFDLITRSMIIRETLLVLEGNIEFAERVNWDRNALTAGNVVVRKPPRYKA